MEIEFVPALRIQNNHLFAEEESYRERGPYAWIPYSEIARYIENDDPDQTGLINRVFLPQTARSDWFWNVWLRNMRKAHRMGALPWSTSDNDG
jgi:hypothetical protein